MIDRERCKRPAADLVVGHAVARAFLDLGKRKTDFPHRHLDVLCHSLASPRHEKHTTRERAVSEDPIPAGICASEPGRESGQFPAGGCGGGAPCSSAACSCATGTAVVGFT